MRSAFQDARHVVWSIGIGFGWAWFMAASRVALIIVDLQADFLPGGALAVPDADAIVGPIGAIAPLFATVVATQDFHPPGHVSFASSHPGAHIHDTLQIHGHPQVLWPDHCVAGSSGAKLVESFPDAATTLILRKGTRAEVDSHSGFKENWGPDGRRADTGLADWLRARGIHRLYVVGLARDYCVRATALDAAAAGFEAFVVDDLTRAVFPDRAAEVDADLKRARVGRLQSPELAAHLRRQ
jgi:nicotinamidase/pyrazinamidase